MRIFHRRNLLLLWGSLALGTAGAEPAANVVTIAPPPLDGKRAPSSPLVPWLAKDGSYGYADRDGKLAIPPRFREARLFYEGFAAVLQSGRWGFIQPSGEFQIAPAYVDLTDFQDGVAQAYTYKSGIDDPIWGKPLVSGTIEMRTIDRRGNVQRNDVTHGVHPALTLNDRTFRRYRSRAQGSQRDWEAVLFLDGKWAARRVDGSKEYRFGELTIIIRDAMSGAASFIATREGTTWKVLNLSGKVVASVLGNVSDVSSEGAFIANQAPHYMYAAFDATGCRLTPAFAAHPFVFYDGVAEAEAPPSFRVASSRVVFVDRSGRIYAHPEFIKELEDYLTKANGGK
jgi:hypothetical protein